MPTQQITVSNSNTNWNSDTSPFAAHVEFYSSMEQNCGDDLASFNTVFINFVSDETFSMDGSNLVITRNWETIDDYNAYKSFIADFENNINTTMQNLGWVISETVN